MSLAAVGKDRGSPFASLTEDYVSRAAALSRGLGMAGPELRVVEAPKALSGVARQEKEQALLDAACPAGHDLILLDERGKNLKSRGLAEMVAKRRDAGGAGLAFVIGGADGFLRDGDNVLRQRAVGEISFGAATWPHMLVRAMLAEQIYRALTILAGHPYHRD